MATECTSGALVFQGSGRREIRADFNGGDITSDAGVLLLQEVERRCAIIEQFAHCFDDHRDLRRVEHGVRELLAQRVFGLALGYEDLNDHDELRYDPLLAAAIGKKDPKGARRSRQRDQGAGLAGKSTLNRIELSKPGEAATDRYCRIVLREEFVDQVFLDVFLQAYPKPPKQITLDLDATDDPLHRKQEGRFFHGYYGHYCYLPLYIFCGDHLLCARLRQADIDASAGTVEELQRIVAHIRSWPKVEIHRSVLTASRRRPRPRVRSGHRLECHPCARSEVLPMFPVAPDRAAAGRRRSGPGSRTRSSATASAAAPTAATARATGLADRADPGQAA